MSALSFLSKKSWHTGLQQNQEAVWKAEKSALEERRKLDELRKERDRERELQDLERLQEEAGGKKKRVEKVDWMYNAPASGTNIDKNELEDYLLGKKRVDKLLKADEGLQHSRGNQQGPIVEQKHVGSDRDVSAKIREDPMFAIKQQEQAAYQALLKDPARLRAMTKAAGIDTETKEERRKRKEEKRRKKNEGSYFDTRDRYEGSSRRDRGDSRGDYDASRREGRRYEEHRQERRYQSGSRDRAYDNYEGEHRNGRQDERDYRYRDDRSENRRDGRYMDERRSQPNRGDDDRHYYYSSSRSDTKRQGSPPRSTRPRSRSPPSRQDRSALPVTVESDVEAEKQAKLAAMQQNASDLTSSRTEYLAKIKKEEDENAQKEEELRLRLQKSKEKGYGDGRSSFLAKQQKDLYGSGLDLNERLKRSKEGLQRLHED
ncbi:hypothetical protein CBS101457_002650 [Exobasidium rhododendri]|nr:hypothetical protein CBS101457_002650 [Exobasidium rhododendri]